MLSIGKIKIKYPVILAPMAGITDIAFRTICKKYGASLVYTEFVSADGIIRENIKTLDMIKFNQSERPIGVQIFGDDPLTVGKSAKYIYDNFKPDIIDINYGCPVPKVTKKGAGSAALKNLSLMRDITTAVIDNVPDIPITAKIRAGWDKNSIVAVEAGILLEEIGISAITLHARTTKQGFTGFSDWSIIKKLKENLSIPVIGNGDVNNVDDYNKMINLTGCDAVMIGRGALGNPWIFRQIINNMNNAKDFPRVSLHEVIDTCINHIDLLKEYKNDITSTNLSKKHINFYIKGFKDSSSWRKKLMKQTSVSNMKKTLTEMKDRFDNSNKSFLG